MDNGQQTIQSGSQIGWSIINLWPKSKVLPMMEITIPACLSVLLIPHIPILTFTLSVNLSTKKELLFCVFDWISFHTKKSKAVTFSLFLTCSMLAYLKSSIHCTAFFKTFQINFFWECQFIYWYPMIDVKLFCPTGNISDLPWCRCV